MWWSICELSFDFLHFNKTQRLILVVKKYIKPLVVSFHPLNLCNSFWSTHTSANPCDSKLLTKLNEFILSELQTILHLQFQNLLSSFILNHNLPTLEDINKWIIMWSFFRASGIELDDTLVDHCACEHSRCPYSIFSCLSCILVQPLTCSHWCLPQSLRLFTLAAQTHCS